MCLCFVSGPDSPLARGSLGSVFDVTVCGSSLKETGANRAQGLLWPSPWSLSTYRPVLKIRLLFAHLPLSLIVVSACVKRTGSGKPLVQIKGDAECVISNFALRQKIKGIKCFLSVTY